MNWPCLKRSAKNTSKCRLSNDMVNKAYSEQRKGCAGYAFYFITEYIRTKLGVGYSEINEKCEKSLLAATMQTLLDNTFKQAVASLLLPISMMGLLFTGVTIIIIYSISRMTIRKESKTYGIYKSIGLSSQDLRLSISIGLIVLSAVGVIIGILLGVYLLPSLLGTILSDYGIAELPLILHWGGILSFAAVTFIAVGIGSWVSSRVIAATSPRILVID